MKRQPFINLSEQKVMQHSQLKVGSIKMWLDEK